MSIFEPPSYDELFPNAYFNQLTSIIPNEEMPFWAIYLSSQSHHSEIGDDALDNFASLLAKFQEVHPNPDYNDINNQDLWTSYLIGDESISPTIDSPIDTSFDIQTFSILTAIEYLYIIAGNDTVISELENLNDLTDTAQTSELLISELTDLYAQRTGLDFDDIIVGQNGSYVYKYNELLPNDDIYTKLFKPDDLTNVTDPDLTNNSLFDQLTTLKNKLDPEKSTIDNQSGDSLYDAIEALIDQLTTYHPRTESVNTTGLTDYDAQGEALLQKVFGIAWANDLNPETENSILKTALQFIQLENLTDSIAYDANSITPTAGNYDDLKILYENMNDINMTILGQNIPELFTNGESLESIFNQDYLNVDTILNKTEIGKTGVYTGTEASFQIQEGAYANETISVAMLNYLLLNQDVENDGNVLEMNEVNTDINILDSIDVTNLEKEDPAYEFQIDGSIYDELITDVDGKIKEGDIVELELDGGANFLTQTFVVSNLVLDDTNNYSFNLAFLSDYNSIKADTFITKGMMKYEGLDKEILNIHISSSLVSSSIAAIDKNTNQYIDTLFPPGTNDTWNKIHTYQFYNFNDPSNLFKEDGLFGTTNYFDLVMTNNGNTGDGATLKFSGAVNEDLSDKGANINEGMINYLALVNREIQIRQKTSNKEMYTHPSDTFDSISQYGNGDRDLPFEFPINYADYSKMKEGDNISITSWEGDLNYVEKIIKKDTFTVNALIDNHDGTYAFSLNFADNYSDGCIPAGHALTEGMIQYGKVDTNEINFAITTSATPAGGPVRLSPYDITLDSLNFDFIDNSSSVFFPAPTGHENDKSSNDPLTWESDETYETIGINDPTGIFGNTNLLETGITTNSTAQLKFTKDNNPWEKEGDNLTLAMTNYLATYNTGINFKLQQSIHHLNTAFMYTNSDDKAENISFSELTLADENLEDPPFEFPINADASGHLYEGQTIRFEDPNLPDFLQEDFIVDKIDGNTFTILFKNIFMGIDMESPVTNGMMFYNKDVIGTGPLHINLYLPTNSIEAADDDSSTIFFETNENNTWESDKNYCFTNISDPKNVLTPQGVSSNGVTLTDPENKALADYLLDFREAILTGKDVISNEDYDDYSIKSLINGYWLEENGTDTNNDGKIDADEKLIDKLDDDIDKWDSDEMVSVKINTTQKDGRNGATYYQALTHMMENLTSAGATPILDAGLLAARTAEAKSVTGHVSENIQAQNILLVLNSIYNGIDIGVDQEGTIANNGISFTHGSGVEFESKDGKWDKLPYDELDHEFSQTQYNLDLQSPQAIGTVALKYIQIENFTDNYADPDASILTFIGEGEARINDENYKSFKIMFSAMNDLKQGVKEKDLSGPDGFTSQEFIDFFELNDPNNMSPSAEWTNMENDPTSTATQNTYNNIDNYMWTERDNMLSNSYNITYDINGTKYKSSYDKAIVLKLMNEPDLLSESGVQKEGTNSTLINALNSSSTFNEINKTALRQSFWILESFYKSASTIITRLQSTLQKINRNIN